MLQWTPEVIDFWCHLILVFDLGSCIRTFWIIRSSKLENYWPDSDAILHGNVSYRSSESGHI